MTLFTTPITKPTPLAAGLIAPALALFSGAPAHALGRPEPWQLGFQEAVTPIMEQTSTFHTFLLWIIAAITVFVLALLVYCGLRFNARANPKASKTSHNTVLEVVWTVVPIIILIVIAVPSFRLLYFQRVIPEADITVKATGNQWYWSYEYPDAQEVIYDSLLLEGDSLAERRKLDPEAPRLLAVDNPVVVPVNKTVRVVVTASDVIHNWAMPSFGIKMDAVPGRLNETWFRAKQTGVFYGQCSELCGSRHAFMPIEVRVVSQERYERWLARAGEEGAFEATQELLASLAAGRRLARAGVPGENSAE